MRVLAHRSHLVDDMERHQTFRFAPGQCHEVRDALAQQIVAAHPDKLCLIPEGEHPELHKCGLNREVALERAREAKARLKAEEYEDTMQAEPVVDKMMRPRMSAQRRKLWKQARRRSGRARLQNPKM